MIEGRVNAAYEAVIRVRLRGPEGQIQELDAVVDTGFNRFLVLPPALVDALALPFVGSSQVTLANGAEERLDLREVTVLWDGEPRHVDALIADGAPLVGMLLLRGHELRVLIRDGGRVTIEADR